MVQPTEINNWKDIESSLDAIIENLAQTLTETESDMYSYFQAARTITQKPIACPKCGTTFDPVELDIDPQRTLDDWVSEPHGEEKAMSFAELRQYARSIMKAEMLRTILTMRMQPSNTEQQMMHLKKSITALQRIATIISDINPAARQVRTKEEMINMLIEAISDIRTAIIDTTK